jgi:hypothetical protein
MEVALRHWRDLTKLCLHPGADHGELEVLKDELQLCGGNCLSPDLGVDSREGREPSGHTKGRVSCSEGSQADTSGVVRLQPFRWD